MAYARTGQHQQALSILDRLKNNYPNRYSIQRDYILVARWMGDCTRVIRGHRDLKTTFQQYRRVALPVARCLREKNRVRQAIRVLQLAQNRSPNNAELKEEMRAAREELSAQFITVEYELSSNNSDAGNREWRGQAMVWREIADNLFVRARFTSIFAADPQFATGGLNRIGVGLDANFGKIDVGGEVSADVIRGGETGVSTTIKYTPEEQWQLTATFHTFSEAVPLRAKALDITSNQRQVGVSYHTSDYVWEWLAVADWMDFSDTNRRREWFTEIGYGLDLNPHFEKRLVIELSQSANNLASTVYFNPLSSQTITAGYKFTRDTKSQFRKKSIEWFFWLGSFQQQNFGSDVIYGLRYEQNIALDDERILIWQVSAASRVYDGTRESELKAGLRYTREFR